MKGFFKWFKSSTKVKRWMFLILVGIVLACYGIAKILVSQELEFIELAKIAGIFVVGFVFIILGIVYIQKRTLELLVQESDSRDIEEKDDVKTLIFNKKVYNQGPKVVVIGGGSGLNTVLKGLKNYTDNITAIVTISDYGAAVSNSRKVLETKPLEDIIDSMIALSGDEDVMRGIMKHEFTRGRLKDLSFGDIYLLGMQEIFGDFSKSIEQARSVLNITGKVLPVTLDEMTICAELDDGTVIESREKIPEVVTSKVSKINRIYLSPSNCRPAQGVLEAIAEADAIVIGPGSLYTNVIPNLLIKGVSKAIKESKAFKIYISNIMTEPGQTDNYTLSDHIKAIVDHVGRGVIDYCIYDTGEIVPEFIRRYNLEGAELIEQDPKNAKTEDMYLIQRNLSYIDGEYIRHNPDAIATAIIQLICEDLKFRDKQNDAQYLMLNDRVKKTKKSLKANKQEVPKQNKKHVAQRGKSKFAAKYRERIESIQESDGKTVSRRTVKKEEEPKTEKTVKQKSKVGLFNRNKKDKKVVAKKVETKKTVEKKVDTKKTPEKKVDNRNNTNKNKQKGKK